MRTADFTNPPRTQTRTFISGSKRRPIYPSHKMTRRTHRPPSGFFVTLSFTATNLRHRLGDLPHHTRRFPATTSLTLFPQTDSSDQRLSIFAIWFSLAAMDENDGFAVSAEQGRSQVFTQLKSYCFELLELFQNPKKSSSSISSLLQFLRQTPSHSLQPFFELSTPLYCALISRVSKKNASEIVYVLCVYICLMMLVAVSVYVILYIWIGNASAFACCTGI